MEFHQNSSQSTGRRQTEQILSNDGAEHHPAFTVNKELAPRESFKAVVALSHVFSGHYFVFPGPSFSLDRLLFVRRIVQIIVPNPRFQ
jgi:hypothetical protein